MSDCCSNCLIEMVVEYISRYSIALSSMPTPIEVERLSKRFKAVLVLVEDHELMYDLDLWGKFGVECLHIPVEDFSAPLLLDLYRGIRWIHRNVCSGRRVLIHCFGGIGRSGTFASAYIVYAGGLTAKEAIRFVRRYVVDAVSTWEQEAIVEMFELLIKALPEPRLAKVVDFGLKYNYGLGLGHASKVTQLALGLWYELSSELNLTIDTLTPLAIAGILHDIGKGIGDGSRHYEKSYRAVLASRELKEVFSKETLELAALLSLYHNIEMGDPRENPRVPGELVEILAKLTGILRVADALDYSLNQVVSDIKVQITWDKMNLIIYVKDSYNISRNIEKAGEKKLLLEDIIGKPIDFIIRYG